MSNSDTDSDSNMVSFQDGSGASKLVKAVVVQKDTRKKKKRKNQGTKNPLEVSFLEKARYNFMNEEFEYRKKLDKAVVVKRMECEQKLFESKLSILTTIQKKVEECSAQELIKDSDLLNSLNNVK